MWNTITNWQSNGAAARERHISSVTYMPLICSAFSTTFDAYSPLLNPLFLPSHRQTPISFYSFPPSESVRTSFCTVFSSLTKFFLTFNLILYSYVSVIIIHFPIKLLISSIEKQHWNILPVIII